MNIGGVQKMPKYGQEWQNFHIGCYKNNCIMLVDTILDWFLWALFCPTNIFLLPYWPLPCMVKNVTSCLCCAQNLSDDADWFLVRLVLIKHTQFWSKAFKQKLYDTIICSSLSADAIQLQKFRALQLFVKFPFNIVLAL